MKKLVLALFVATLGVSGVSGQESRFAFTGGYSSLAQKMDIGGASVSVSIDGYYVGVKKSIEVTDSYSIEPELQFSSCSFEGEKMSMFALPVMAKFYVSEKANLKVGPQLDLLTGDTEDANVLGISLAAGLEYSVSDRVSIATKYSLGLNNRYNGDDFGDTKIKFNVFQIGLAFEL